MHRPSKPLLPVTTAMPLATTVFASMHGAAPKVALTAKTFFPEARGVSIPLMAQPREVAVLKLSFG